MAPTIHLVRHAQGFHNLCEENHKIHDPLLTPVGKQQCADLQDDFPHHSGVDLIVASPIRRTIYTSLLGFDKDLHNKGLQVIALPELQETSDLPCDTGSAPEELAKEFADKPVDLGLVKEGWNVKAGKWAATREAIAERAQEAREWLRSRPEQEIVVVTHGGLLHYLTEDWGASDKFPGTGWANTEFRSYHWDESRPNSAHLLETDESMKRRSAKPLDHNETTQLKHTESAHAAQEAAHHAESEAKRASDITKKV